MLSFCSAVCKLNRAADSYREAIRLIPTYANAHVGLGNTFRVMKDMERAAECYREAIRLAPNLAPAHTGLGSVLRVKGQTDEAIACFRQAIQLDSTSVIAHYNLGNALVAKRELDAAIASYRQAIHHDPKYTPAHNNLGMTLRTKGDLGGAVECYQESIRIDPSNARAHNNLAWLLAAGPVWIRDGARAVELSQRACELTDWKTTNYLETLATACAEAGDFAKAVEYQKRVLSTRSLPKSVEAEARKQLASYVRKQPYRDPALARREPAPQPRAAK